MPQSMQSRHILAIKTVKFACEEWEQSAYSNETDFTENQGTDSVIKFQRHQWENDESGGTELEIWRFQLDKKEWASQ